MLRQITSIGNHIERILDAATPSSVTTAALRRHPSQMDARVPVSKTLYIQNFVQLRGSKQCS